MDFSVLKNLEFSNSEIRVYEALFKLGQSSVGAIVEKAEVSSSKIYIILNRLIDLGLVSQIKINNINFYEVIPSFVLEKLVKNREIELEKTKKKVKELIEEMKSFPQNSQKDNVQLFFGESGLKIAFESLINELDDEDEYLFFSISNDELNRKTEFFFKNINNKRILKKIKSKGIVHPDMRRNMEEKFLINENYDLKFSDITFPTGLTIGKNKVLMTLWNDDLIAFEIHSKRMAERFRKYFYILWDKLK